MKYCFPILFIVAFWSCSNDNEVEPPVIPTPGTLLGWDQHHVNAPDDNVSVDGRFHKVRFSLHPDGSLKFFQDPTQPPKPFTRKSETTYTYYDEPNQYPLRKLEAGQQYAAAYLLWNAAFERLSGKRLQSYRDTVLSGAFFEYGANYSADNQGAVTEMRSWNRSRSAAGVYSAFTYHTEKYIFGK